MEQPVSRTPSAGVLTSAIAILAIGVVGAGAFSVREYKVAKAASQQNTEMTAALKTTNAQVEALSAKLNELSTPKPAPVPEVATRKPAATRTHKTARRADDPRWKKLQSQVDEQGKAIDATRQDLDSAKTELSGSIARTHDELVVLQRKGERNYTEFDIDKSKQFSQHGPVGIKLRKANVKNQYADLELMVDDVKLTKKHVNLYEPSTFVASDGDQPIQVVINKITKDHIRGYISTPKYNASELNAMSKDAQPSQPDNSVAIRQRQKMTVPQ